MANVVFDVSFEEETLIAIQDLRKIRKDVFQSQIENIDKTMKHLIDTGAILPDEKLIYQKDIILDLKSKILKIEERIKFPEVVYSDELELYLDLLAEPN